MQTVKLSRLRRRCEYELWLLYAKADIEVDEQRKSADEAHACEVTNKGTGGGVFSHWRQCGIRLYDRQVVRPPAFLFMCTGARGI